MNFGSISTAMVTPFDSKGNIDFGRTTKLVNHLLNNGTDSLVVAGTTGESATLTTEEKIALFKHVVKVVDGRVPVVAGTGSNNTKASIDLSKKAEEIGVDAIMIVAPYYNKPSQEGIIAHYKAIASAISLPIMAYNIPGRSVITFSVETVLRLAEVPNIVALKDAGGNLDTMSEVIENTPDDFVVYSGDDGLTLPSLAIGSAGIVSVASHVIGNEMQTMIKAFSNGENKEAARIHRKLLPVMQELFKAPSPAPVKTALQLRGLDVGGVRLPLLPLNQSEREALSNRLNSL
ncbi:MULTISPECIES: 4-hydroxy-tetrahydrodipicolinate synthase [Fictibacillus]|jgi:4-hydroxy-tetrahydrodipicolinate synthase|uniref:4-hydroxy-tetrahydrodipicolinate synthase n=1 Tax=Fictibacillus TaxID=1329200 RepID=UPI0018CEAD65|nr:MULTISPECIES: 4-hydroxy-tetrahydrodipicolinate synthase [unclassified Fictibacillus]MBH0155938.1 4-hydroxy-tetrahydrodipicolinate synthase [Fictibacillus sp. 5RED26]MBH0165820.1 4-hydroxy-tetrahydrodipicolinate synthase [Fictibacillus sp. 7GRE50]